MGDGIFRNGKVGRLIGLKLEGATFVRNNIQGGIALKCRTGLLDECSHFSHVEGVGSELSVCIDVRNGKCHLLH